MTDGVTRAGATGATDATAADAAPHAVVLAGGASRRFGGDKLAADLDGEPVLHHALRAVDGVAREIVLVLPPGAPPPVLPAAMTGRILIAHDPESFRGPLAGLSAGIEAMGPRAADARCLVLVVGADMPDLVPEVLRLLVDRLRAETRLAALVLDAVPPAPLPLVVRPAAARGAIASCLAGGRRSLRCLLDAVASTTLPAADWRRMDPGGRTLRDIDEPGDLARR